MTLTMSRSTYEAMAVPLGHCRQVFLIVIDPAVPDWTIVPDADALAVLSPILAQILAERG